MLELRCFESSDCDCLIDWIPDARFLLQFAGPGYSWPLDKAQLEQTLQAAQGEDPGYYRFKAVDGSTDEGVGHIQLGVNREKRTGLVQRVLVGNPACRGKGMGVRMLSLLCEFAFKELQLKELTLSVFDFNASAIACYERVGFEESGRKDGARQFGEESWNAIFMSLKRSDWA